MNQSRLLFFSLKKDQIGLVTNIGWKRRGLRDSLDASRGKQLTDCSDLCIIFYLLCKYFHGQITHTHISAIDSSKDFNVLMNKACFN